MRCGDDTNGAILYQTSVTSSFNQCFSTCMYYQACLLLHANTTGEALTTPPVLPGPTEVAIMALAVAFVITRERLIFKAAPTMDDWSLPSEPVDRPFPAYVGCDCDSNYADRFQPIFQNQVITDPWTNVQWYIRCYVDTLPYPPEDPYGQQLSINDCFYRGMSREMERQFAIDIASQLV